VEPKPSITDIQLPEGVTLAEWALEKARWQNPRIRAFLGCIRVLDEVFESNYAILHCSPNRLTQVWEQIRKISGILRQEVAPLLTGSSKIPDLEQARESASLYLNVLDKNLLKEIDRYPAEFEAQSNPEIRKLLCVAIGQLHAFLLDTLGEILACDPRSHNDADYFLARKFARDVDEAEWLYTSVSRLQEYLHSIPYQTPNIMSTVGERMTKRGSIPSVEEWDEVSGFLNEVIDNLVGRLKMILGLRGIRLSELELLDRHASELPAMCRTLKELYESAHTALTTLEDKQDSNDHKELNRTVNKVFCERMTAIMSTIHGQIRDLSTYLPVWRQCIENRRAMMLKRRHDV